MSLALELLNDDIQKVTLKIKIPNFPLKLKRKLEHTANHNGIKLEQLITFLLDNEIQSVEKTTGKINLD